MYSEYQLFGAEASARGKRLGIAGSFASIANRVSYALQPARSQHDAGHHVLVFVDAPSTSPARI